MNVVVRDIGNSKGIIIPTHALKEAGIGKIADLHVKDDCIIVKAVKHPRADWLDAIQQDPPEEHEPVFMEGVEDLHIMEDWEW
ncbi:AbrB/MazE/SpoVT family DNA-binding domain-containing protein [Candidatus Nitrospira salsa]|nr:MAG: hypothetical protein NPIRA01_21970 [Nitrospirales bacterium]